VVNILILIFYSDVVRIHLFTLTWSKLDFEYEYNLAEFRPVSSTCVMADAIGDIKLCLDDDGSKTAAKGKKRAPSKGSSCSSLSSDKTIKTVLFVVLLQVLVLPPRVRGGTVMAADMKVRLPWRL
jgi:hypothetical protein